MKKILSIFSMLALFLTVANAQAVPAGSNAEMAFEVTEIDYGTIEQGSDPLRIFKFTNKGTEPLIIKNAKGSCGCTVPSYPKEPIMPGEAGAIEVRYDTNRVGPFTKRVTITTNENGENTRVLTIKGNVNKKEEAPGVPTNSSNMFNGN
ncbi:MAG TPA: DUF1573 domain-containing protein [Saprospiraceae bacterium]|nr:DUF1573 domain-containing protein [Saprospiraceae bacterium]